MRNKRPTEPEKLSELGLREGIGDVFELMTGKECADFQAEVMAYEAYLKEMEDRRKW